jgi:GAF domain-containing protein
MSFVQIESYLKDPLVLGIAAASIVLVIIIILLLARRSRHKQKHDAARREQLMAVERERQFAAAAEQVPFRTDATEVANEIAGLFREYLSASVLAVYAGREGEDELSNILEQSAITGQLDAARAQSLPEAVPAAMLSERGRPHIATLSPSSGQRQVNTSPLDQQTEQAGQSESASVEQTSPEQPAVMLIPWRGPLLWRGMIVTAPSHNVTVETVSRFQDPIARLTDRIAVALEFESERAELFALDERATRGASFARALFTSLEEAQPLASIAREVARLLSADSAALWRVEPNSSMVRMVAAYGLKSAEFLPLPVGQGLAGSIIQTGESISLTDAPADPRCIFPREARESGIVSYLGEAIVANDKTIGVVEAHTSEPRKWSEGDERSLKSAASMIAEVFRTSDTRGNRLRVESAYLGLSEALQRLRSPDEVMEAAVEVLGHSLGVSRAMIVELDDQGKPQPVRFEYRIAATSALGASFKESAFEKLVSSPAEIVAINDSREGSLVGPEVVGTLQILSEMAVPVRLEGTTRAVIYLNQCDRVREWHHEEMEFADRVSRQLSLSLSNVRSLDSAVNDAQAARDEMRRAGEVATRAQSVINVMPEMIVGLDREGRLTFFNPAARDRLGLKMENIGQMVEMIEAFNTADETVWHRIASSDGVLRLDSQLAKSASGEDERGPRVSISSAPIRNNKGEVTGHLAVITDISHAGEAPAASTIKELERRLAEMERELNEARAAENQARAMLAKASAAEAKARAEADVLRRSDAEVRQEMERLREDQARAQASARQLLDINRLKSEFLVNAGREMEASLQSVLGFAELLEQGSYGSLSPDQHEAVRNLYVWARRMKGDIDTLIEYGSTRSRRLEEGGEGRAE